MEVLPAVTPRMRLAWIAAIGFVVRSPVATAYPLPLFAAGIMLASLSLPDVGTGPATGLSAA